ncbi:MAG: prohibitin family protein [Chloroflexota bacterium]
MSALSWAAWATLACALKSWRKRPFSPHCLSMIDNILSVISVIGWVLFSLYIFATVATKLRQGRFQEAVRTLFNMRVVSLLLLVIGINLLSLALVFIEPPQVGVVVSIVSPKGIRQQPLSPGLHWIVPFAEETIIYPTIWQTYTMSGKPLEGQEAGNDSIRARTSDGQEVTLDVSVIFRIDRAQAIRIHTDWQERYIEEFVRPIIRGFVRTQVSQFTVEEVNSSARKDLEATLDTQLKAEFEEKGLILDQFLLRDVTFSNEYATAIENKQVALEGQLEKQYEAEQIRQLAEGQADKVRIDAQANADKIKIEAEAEAEAIRVKAEAQAEALGLIEEVISTNPDLITYEYVQQLSPNISVMLLPNDTPLILPAPDLQSGVGVEDLETAVPQNTDAEPGTNNP